MTDIQLGGWTRFPTLILTSQFDIQVTIDFVTIQENVGLTAPKGNTLVLILDKSAKCASAIEIITYIYMYKYICSVINFI